MKNKLIALALVVIGIIAIIGLFRNSRVIVQAPPQGAVPGIDNENAVRCQQGQCEFVTEGTFADATTTLFSVKNPTGQTALVNLSLINLAVATSSYTIGCGTTTQATTNNLSSTSTIASGLIATSSNFGVMVSGISVGSATSSAPNGILWTQVLSTEYLICKVTPASTGGATPNSSTDRAFLDVTNTFTGRFHALWRFFSRN